MKYINSNTIFGQISRSMYCVCAQCTSNIIKTNTKREKKQNKTTIYSKFMIEQTIEHIKKLQYFSLFAKYLPILISAVFALRVHSEIHFLSGYIFPPIPCIQPKGGQEGRVWICIEREQCHHFLIFLTPHVSVKYPPMRASMMPCYSFYSSLVLSLHGIALKYQGSQFLSFFLSRHYMTSRISGILSLLPLRLLVCFTQNTHTHTQFSHSLCVFIWIILFLVFFFVLVAFYPLTFSQRISYIYIALTFMS